MATRGAQRESGAIQRTRRLSLAIVALAVAVCLGCGGGTKSYEQECEDKVYDLAQETGLPAGSYDQVKLNCSIAADMRRADEAGG